MAEHSTNLKKVAEVDLSQPLSTAAPEVPNPLEHTIDVQLPSAARIEPEKHIEKEHVIKPVTALRVETDEFRELQLATATKPVSVETEVMQSQRLNNLEQVQVMEQHADLQAERLKFSPNLNPSLNHEYFKVESKTGYVNTILDVIMNLIAEFLTRLDRFLFGRKSRSKNDKKQAVRDAELEEFMSAQFKNSLDREKLLKKEPEFSSLEASRQERSEKIKLAQDVAMDHHWDGESK